MLFIFGTKPVGTAIQQGIFSCPNCRTERNYLLKRYKTYFTLFFIPLIPLKYLGNSAECQVCKKSYVPESILPTYESTPQNYTLSASSQTLGLIPAPPIRRFGAYIIDMLILTVLTFPTAFLVKTFPFELQNYLIHNFYLVIFLLYFLYFFACEYFTKGYTIGKKALSIQTVEKDEDRYISMGQALIRSLIKIIPALSIVLLFTENNRAVHDYAAGSIVVQKL